MNRWPEDWDVPAHEVALYSEKRSRHALVIPVINEGERLRGQLLRIMAADLPVDVIVADGGSTDGSLEPDFIQTANVRAVLTKTGPGKLSAQLRMAYAWCLAEGYEGLVTIDGNGKDGVEAVADMVAKLEDGCDYVQGSRYLPGGEAENTPLERTIANRLIHAPLLSLAGHQWFTDTTNGFRGYSARYLTHPDVRPFRDEFRVYGLLFYLTVRAGQLGLKVGHVPVQRRYPEDGKVPTKIGGFASKMALLGETVHAATGGYTPDEAARKAASPFWASVIAALVALPLLIAVWVMPPYTPDSWAFYELSKTVFGDFYRFSHFRSYADTSPYSSAFPPLYPTLIALVDGMFGTGARTGLYIAFASFIAFAGLSETIGRRVTKAAGVGLAAALLLLLGPKMLLVELQAGRTIPLQLCFYALIILGLFARERITVVGAFGIGIAAGLAVLNRFDALPLPLLAAMGAAWVSAKPMRAAQVMAGSVIAVLPWIAYSWTTFGTVFASDNSGVLTALDPSAFVTDWWPEPQPGMTDDPVSWLGKVLGNIGQFAWTAAALAISLMGLAFAGAVAVLGGLQYLASGRPDANSPAILRSSKLHLLLGASIACAIMLGPQIATGYLEYRYFSAPAWTVILLALSALVLRGTTTAQRAIFARIACIIVLAIAVAFSAITLMSASAKGDLDTPNFAEFDEPADIAQLKACVGEDSAARILVIGDDNFAARAGALGGIATMMEPRNMAQGRLAEEEVRDFLRQWNVSHILLLDPGRDDFVAQIPTAMPPPGCPLELFSITPRPG